jgi:cell division protein FtsN
MRKTPSHNAKATSSSFPAWAWLLGGLLLGLISSNLFYWKVQNPLHQKKQEKPAIQKTSKKEAAEKKHAAQTRFDFYTMLPSMKEEELDTEQEETQRQQFIIQVGSFRDLNQAEELKAQLALLGFEASIQTMKITDKDMWYRVYMGPFKAKEIALQKQQQIEQAQELHSLVLKIRV